MLNAVLLRKRLAEVAGIEIKDEILAKLMVLEYTHLKRFHELNGWQASENGHPKKLKLLEEFSIEEAQIMGETPAKDALDKSLEGWQTPSLQNWLRMQPSLSSVDLRDYFWLARDRTNSTLAGINMVPPLVRRLFEQLISGNDGEQKIAVKEANKLGETEIEALLQLIQQQIERHPDQETGLASLFLLAEGSLASAINTLFKVLSQLPVEPLPPTIPPRLKVLGSTNPAFKEAITKLLEHWSKQPETKVGKAAKVVLNR